MITDWVIGGGLIGLMALILKNNKDYDDKIGRAYQRLDEIKKDNEGRFSRKDVCEILHKQIDTKLTEISTDIKLLLKK